MEEDRTPTEIIKVDSSTQTPKKFDLSPSESTFLGTDLSRPMYSAPINKPETGLVVTTKEHIRPPEKFKLGTNPASFLYDYESQTSMTWFCLLTSTNWRIYQLRKQ